jgi:glycosyltransferase involved in cell wall biosynthesis
MKLLVITPEYLPTSGGGIVTYYRHLLPALVRAGVEVTVLVGSAVASPGGAFTRDGVRVVGLDPAGVDAQRARLGALVATPLLQRQLASAWALWAQARALGPFDAVECADWGLSAVPWILEPGPAVRVRCHGSAGQIARAEGAAALRPADALLLEIERRVFARASEVVSYGAPNAAQWSGWLGRACAHREPALPVDATTATADAPWLLVLARVQAWKGPQVLGAALEPLPAPPAVRWVGRDVPDLPAGEPSTLATLRRRFPRTWTTTVDHRDTVESAQALAWVRGARAVLVPSTWDVFNFAGAEAMAAGAVVVASEGAGMARWIEDGESGLRVPAGDAERLREAVQRVAAMDAATRRRFGERAREAVARRAAPDTVAAGELAATRALVPRIVAEDPLDALLRPAPGEVALDAVLAQFPMRALVGHLGKRVRARWGRR